MIKTNDSSFSTLIRTQRKPKSCRTMRRKALARNCFQAQLRSFHAGWFFRSREKTALLRLPFLTPLYQFRAVSLGQPASSLPVFTVPLKFQLFPGPESRCFPFSSAKRNKHRETTNYATALFFPHLPECTPFVSPGPRFWVIPRFFLPPSFLFPPLLLRRHPAVHHSA